MAITISNCIEAYWMGIVLFLIPICFRPGSDAANVSSEEYLKLRRQLKSLNKPAVKTIKTVHGDIFDCVDIHKQPAFDHPLLKDHKIQMWPTSFPKRLESMQNSSGSGMEMRVGLPDGGCPQGTVPIRRTRMQDLLRNKSLRKLKNKAIKEHLAGSHHVNMAFEDDLAGVHHWAGISTRGVGRYYGARADLNLWNPWVGEGQFSVEQFWLSNGDYAHLNTVEFGWMDVKTHNWWVTVGYDEKPLVYFPKSLFTTLADGANTVQWGGEIYSPWDFQPQMGSGHFPSEGFGKAAFMKMIMTVDDQHELKDAPTDVDTFADEPNCYKVDHADQYGDKYWRRSFYFGGPGDR
ncbi:hypothetical protein ACLOJK_029576 [Asimina triloba]